MTAVSVCKFDLEAATLKGIADLSLAQTTSLVEVKSVLEPNAPVPE